MTQSSIDLIIDDLVKEDLIKETLTKEDLTKETLTKEDSTKETLTEKTTINIESKIIDITSSIKELSINKPHAFIRYFNNSNIKYVSSVLMSAYVLYNTYDVFNIFYKKIIEPYSIKINEPIYIINIIYDLKENIKNKTGDTQLFMTGSVEYNETSLAATISEIKEELQLEPKNASCIKYFCCNTFNNIKYNWYYCSVTDLQNITNDENKRIENNRTNKNKVGCMVYGTLIEMLQVISNIKCSDEMTTESIAGLVCMESKDVLDILNIIKVNKYKSLDKFYWNKNKSYEYAFNGRYFPKHLL
jgi:ADP-ribose pyrophosphatase YjhB (NUDIX family)